MRVLAIDPEADIRFISGGSFEARAPWTHAKRTIDSYEIIYVLEGVFWMSANGISYRLCAGDFLLIRPNEPHFGTNESTPGLRFFWLHFLPEPSRIKTLMLEAGAVTVAEKDVLLLPDSFSAAAADRLKIFFKDLMHYIAAKDTIVLPLRSLTALILCEASDQFRRLSQPGGSSDRMVEEICEYIRAGLHADLAVSQLAVRFGYNEKYFISLFKNHKGITPMQFILNARISRAKLLLSTTSLYIREIALQTGFGDEKAFCKCFKKREGLTPTQFRINLSGNHYNFI